MERKASGVGGSWLLVVVWMAAAAGMAGAHSMKQVRAGIATANGDWRRMTTAMPWSGSICTGGFPGGVDGPLRLAWEDDENEPLTLQVRIPRPDGTERTALLRLAPRDDSAELMVIRAGATAVEDNGSSLLDWIPAGFSHKDRLLEAG